MNIIVNKTINYDVKQITIDKILMNVRNNKLNIVVPYKWIDADQKVIRFDINKYTEEQLIQGFSLLSQDFSPVISVLKTFISTSDNVTINFKDVITVIKQKQLVKTGLTQQEFIQAISPLTLEQINSLVIGFTQLVLEN